MKAGEGLDCRAVFEFRAVRGEGCAVFSGKWWRSQACPGEAYIVRGDRPGDAQVARGECAGYVLHGRRLRRGCLSWLRRRVRMR